MTEELIRGDVRNWLHCMLPSGAQIVEEMEVCSGRARIDLAVISDVLIGIEIKGPRDDLNRLPGQIEHYSRCFDLVVLVVHQALVKKALAIAPHWWGIVVASEKDGCRTYAMNRRPTPNKAVEVDVLLSLLWRQEIEALFGTLLNVAAPAKASKRKLRERLLSNTSLPQLKAAGLDLLRGRQDWRLVAVNG